MIGQAAPRPSLRANPPCERASSFLHRFDHSPGTHLARRPAENEDPVAEGLEQCGSILPCLLFLVSDSPERERGHGVHRA